MYFQQNDGFLDQGILIGSGMIITKVIKLTPFDLTEQELLSIFELL